MHVQCVKFVRNLFFLNEIYDNNFMVEITLLSQINTHFSDIHGFQTYFAEISFYKFIKLKFPNEGFKSSNYFELL